MGIIKTLGEIISGDILNNRKIVLQLSSLLEANFGPGRLVSRKPDLVYKLYKMDVDSGVKYVWENRRFQYFIDQINRELPVDAEVYNKKLKAASIYWPIDSACRWDCFYYRSFKELEKE